MQTCSNLKPKCQRFLDQVHVQINHAHSNKLMWTRAYCMLKITWPNLTFITDVITISTHAHQQSNKCISLVQIHLQQRVDHHWWSRIQGGKKKKKEKKKKMMCTPLNLYMYWSILGWWTTNRQTSDKSQPWENQKRYCCIIIYLYWIPH